MPLDAPPNAQLPRIAMRAEMLDARTEYRLAIAWRDDRDEAALHRLITAYMRLAVSMASKFRRYGAPMNDLIQEAGLGLMKAAEKFDPGRGVRFSTYAMWWVRAGVQDYVMRNWSLVRMGSTSAQKSLFFNMRRVQARLEREAMAEGTALAGYRLRAMIAAEIGVPLRDVEQMGERLAGMDLSLNASQSSEDEGREWIETLKDAAPRGDQVVERAQDQSAMQAWLKAAMAGLSARERHIVCARHLSERPRTLESLGRALSLSKERIRQVEAAALGKMRLHLEQQGPEVHDLLA
jgi:RNA polymerase sigma-32 factor